jgi:hypothetical protein
VTRRLSSVGWLPAMAVPVMLALGLGAAQPVWSSTAVGSVKVMDPDEVGDAALIARAKAQKRAEEGLPGLNSSTGPGNGCSDINIGNIQGTKPWQRVPTKVVNIIEGPIIQENKCR